MAFHALSGKAGEVEKLIYFFMEGLPILETGLNRLLKPYRVNVVVSGIFCHQTPKVISISPRASTASCELGDIALLTIYEDMPANMGLGNALLLQAKEHFHAGAAPDQELLYETTDIFKYASPKPLTSQTRSLAAAQSCLYYWDLSCRWHYGRSHHSVCSTSALLARPKPASLHYRSAFEDIVTDLFCGIVGRGYQKIPAGNGWTAIIHDLVKNASIRAVSHRKIFSSHGQRPPSRLFNYISALREFGAQTMVRCSLGEFLLQFEDEKVKAAGAKLEQEAREFQWKDRNSDEFDQTNGKSDLPPLNRGDESDDGSGGGSFVVFQFKSAATS
jgi:hypothetical protein